MRLVVKSIQDSRRISLADAAFNADRDGPAVGESLFRVMAATASDSSISRQATLEEHSLAEGNFPGGFWLSDGIDARVASAGTPTCLADFGWASGSASEMSTASCFVTAVAASASAIGVPLSKCS